MITELRFVGHKKEPPMTGGFLFRGLDLIEYLSDAQKRLVRGFNLKLDNLCDSNPHAVIALI